MSTMQPTLDVVSLIATERMRQIGKGFDAAHILTAATLVALDDPDFEVDDGWPDKLAAHVREKYRGDPIKRLVIAAALIVAEIERLNRNSK